MRLPKSVGIALLGVCLVSPPTGVPGAIASESAAPALAGSNTITAERSGSIEVVVLSEVTLPLATRGRAQAGPASWLTFEGGGRVVGVVLAQRRLTGVGDGYYTDWYSGLNAAQFRSCPHQTCSERPVNALSVGGASYRGKEPLGPGTYQLYLFTDERPVTVTLNLPGLKGATELEIQEPEAFHARTPTAFVDQTDSATAYSAGASYEMKGSEGLFMAVNVLRDPEYRGGGFHECLSAERPVPDRLEDAMCMPGGNTFVHADHQSTIDPRNGGFILTSFFGVSSSQDNAFNGDSHLQHYNFRVFSPGSMGELWSQAALVTF